MNTDKMEMGGKLVPPREIGFDNLNMPSTLTFSGVLLLAASGGTMALLGGCSGQIKVQRVMYQSPEVVVERSGDGSDLVAESLAVEEAVYVRPDFGHRHEGIETIEEARLVLEGFYDLDSELVKASTKEDPNRIHSLSMIAEIDRLHAETLKRIIERFGWPTREMVGIKAVQGAYIAIQHAGADPEFQANCLALIQQQVDQGELPGAFLALMTDRVCLLRGEAQVYGTQMTMAVDEFGVMKAVPAAEIREIGTLDQRRSALGMPPHGRFIEVIEIAYFESMQQAGSRVSSVPVD